MDPSKCTFAFHRNNSDQIAGSYELDSGDHWLSRSVKFNLASPKVGCPFTGIYRAVESHATCGGPQEPKPCRVCNGALIELLTSKYVALLDNLRLPTEYPTRYFSRVASNALDSTCYVIAMKQYGQQ